MKGVDWIHLEIDFTAAVERVNGSLDPEEFCHDIDCMIKGLPEDLNECIDEEPVEIGSIYAQTVNFNAVHDSEYSIYDVLDANSQDSSDYRELFDPASRLIRECPFVDRLLMIHKMTIDEAYRGQGVGLLAMNAFIKAMNAEAIAIKPFPLQFTSNVTDENRSEFNTAQAKLRKYWGRLGFKRASPKSELYFLDAARMKRPTTKQKTRSAAR